MPTCYTSLLKIHSQLRFGVRNMHITKECFLPFNVALALQKDSLLTNAFNEKIDRLVEGGLIHKWTNDEFNKIARKVDFHTNLETRALNIHHLQVNQKLAYEFDLGLIDSQFLISINM